MNPEPSDFLVSAPDSGTKMSAGAVIGHYVRRGWWLTLPLIAVLPVAVSLFSQYRGAGAGDSPKSYSQAVRERDPAGEAGGLAASSDPAGTASAPAADPGSAEPSPSAPPDSPASAESPAGSPAEAATPRAAEEVPSPPHARSAVIHLVRVGDTLSEIALHYGSSAEAIAEANGREVSDAIRTGERLTIPLPRHPDGRVITLEPVHGMSGHPELAPAAPRRDIDLTPAPQPGAQVSRAPHSQPEEPAAPEPPKARVVLGPPAPVPALLPPPSSQTGPSAIAPVHGLPQTRTYPREEDYRPIEMGARPGPATGAGPVARPGNGLPSAAGEAGSEGGLISYVVQPFDTLASIAKAHSTTPEAIRSLNGVDFIRLGDTILVPIRESRIAGSAARSR